MSTSPVANVHRQIMVGFANTAVGFVIVCAFVWIIYQFSRTCYSYAWEAAKIYMRPDEDIPSHPSVVCSIGGTRGPQLGKKFTYKTGGAYLVELEDLYNKNVKRILSATNQSFAITNRGVLYSFGVDNGGELAQNIKNVRREKQSLTGQCIYQPTIVNSVAGKKIIDISHHDGMFVAVSNEGRVFEWGRDLPLQRKYTSNVSLPSKIYKVYRSTESYALTNRGELYRWSGENLLKLWQTQIRLCSFHKDYKLLLKQDGSILIFHPGSTDYRTITELMGQEVKRVECGDGYFLALTESGTVYSWGNNFNYQLGLGDRMNRDFPTLIEGLSNLKVTKVGVTQDDNSYALTEDGDLYMWGRGFMRTFWYLLESDCSLPQKCKFLKDWIVTDISFGESHALVICKLVYVDDVVVGL
ncbi:E3 ubiquitin-protein ligase HERC [Acrasis kona]|uniref:E3 ubiquitin-protein ligase HERC n=1 Tax=Acrasis kona TaxID=1008807 RepID=A0AAW2Z6Q2_9EUKA